MILPFTPPYETIGFVVFWAITGTLTLLLSGGLVIGTYIGVVTLLQRIQRKMWADADPYNDEPPTYWKWRISFFTHQCLTLLYLDIPMRWSTYQDKLNESDSEF